MSVGVRSLGSGSSGNGLLIEGDGTSLVVDCGIGPRVLASGLRAAGRTVGELDAVLLTHEHVDHVRALPRVIKERVPVIATAGTLRAAGIAPGGAEAIALGGELAVAGASVTAIGVSHDAAEPCGYHVRLAGMAVTVVTDLGRPEPALAAYLAAADLIVIEANHDEAMLRAGPYPAHLKRRVLSATGHLSNAACGRLLLEALAGSRRRPTVWLAHLSTTNNRPTLARQTVQRAIAAGGFVAPVVPLPRHGHDLVWRPGLSSAETVQLSLPLG